MDDPAEPPELINVWQAFCIWLGIDESDPVSLFGKQSFEALIETRDAAAPHVLWAAGLVGVGLALLAMTVLFVTSSNAAMVPTAAGAVVLFGIAKRLYSRGRHPSQTDLLARSRSEKHRALLRKFIGFCKMIADENREIRDANGKRVPSEMLRSSEGWTPAMLSYSCQGESSARGWSLPLRVSLKSHAARSNNADPSSEPGSITTNFIQSRDPGDVAHGASAPGSKGAQQSPRKKLHWLTWLSRDSVAALISHLQKSGYLTPQEEEWFEPFMLAAWDIAQDGPITVTSLAKKAAARCQAQPGTTPYSIQTAEDWLGFRKAGRYARFYCLVVESPKSFARP